MASKPGPVSHDPFSPLLPAQTPGTLGVRDRADPNANAQPGNTPGSTGINDAAAHGATGRSALPVRMLSSAILAAASDAGPLKTGLFVYHTGTDTIPESKNICSEPIKGPYRKAVYVENVKALAAAVGSAEYKVSALGILVHGDAGGRLWIGNDELNPATIEDYKGAFETLSKNLAKDATVFAYGCVSGLGKDGSVLLKELSRLLPGRKIVGFNVVNSVKPTSMRKEGEGFLGMGGHPCYDPEVWATSVRSALVVNAPGGSAYVNAATVDAPQAKVAQDGKITKWPSDESPKKDDANKQDVLKNWKRKQ